MTSISSFSLAQVAMQLTAHFKLDPQSGGWTATVAQVPAVVTQGKTLEETHTRVRAALAVVRPDLAKCVLNTQVVFNNQ